MLEPIGLGRLATTGCSPAGIHDFRGVLKRLLWTVNAWPAMTSRGSALLPKLPTPANPVRRRRSLVGWIASVAGLLLIFGAAARSEPTGDAKISIDNFTFAPSVIEVKQGQDVTWTNHDDIPHVVVFAALGTKSKTLDTDDTYAFHFDKTGTFDYICGLHPAMRGKIVVR